MRLIGYRTAHWVNHDKNNQIVDWEDILSFDAMFDTPVASIFESLYFAFPDAYFIYSQRNIEQWIKSANQHFFYAKKFSNFKKLCLEGNNKGDVFDSPHWRMIHLSLYANCSSFKEAYELYEQRVSRFFAEKTTAKLLKIDITGPELSSRQKWEAIRDYLQLDDEKIPLLPFPKQNSKDSLGQRQDPELKMPLPESWQLPLGVEIDAGTFADLLSNASAP
jgi:hypothetical protein